MSEGGTPPFHHDFSASAKSPLKRLFSRNSAAENRRALFLELLWTGRIPVL
jgi:hypothetical protein